MGPRKGKMGWVGVAVQLQTATRLLGCLRCRRQKKPAAYPRQLWAERRLVNNTGGKTGRDKNKRNKLRLFRASLPTNGNSNDK